VNANVFLPSGEKKLILFDSIPPVAEIGIDKIIPRIPGTELLLADHEVFIEGSAEAALGAKAGDTITVELFDGSQRQLRVAEIVHSVTAFPFNFTQQVPAYITPETAYWLGGSFDANIVYLTVEGNARDEANVRAVAELVADKIEASGRTVYTTFVYNPGRHFAADITASLGAMMGFLGGLSILLSAFLVFSTVNAVLTQQVRQIGIMKSVGATTFQLVGMYLVLVLIIGLLALAVFIPLGETMNSVGNFVSVYLNFMPGPNRIPPQTLILQVFVALVVPVAAALLPVIKGTRLSVREAISDYGLGRGEFGKSRLDRLVERIRGLPRPLLISLRNSIRRKSRLLLTLSTLTLAGGIFIGVFNLRASMNSAINETFGYLLSDVNVGFSQSQRLDKVLPLARSVPGVVNAEAWDEVLASLLMPDGKSGTEVWIYAPPSSSTMIDPTLTGGRWLLPEDENAVVIGNHIQKARPELKIGDTIQVDIDGDVSSWVIVGTYRMAGNIGTPIMYANNDYLGRLLNSASRTPSLRIATEYHDEFNQKRIAADLERVLKSSGVDVANTITGAELIRLNTSQTDILVYFLLVMSVLIAVVGGLGLMTTMSLNVFERTREIGVMRAIGATSKAILQLVIVEGVLIGVISWMLGALLAIPIGTGLANVVGVTMLQSPLEFSFALDGFLAWLAGVLFISVLASALPARNASRLTIREVLAYE
jgi:putative ABC transport system permease protein